MEDRQGPPITVETHVAEKPEPGKPNLAPVQHTLTDMSQDYTFFTTALLTLAGFNRDILVEYQQHHPQQPQPISIDYKAAPFFKGLGLGTLLKQPVHWDYRLYAIPHAGWEKLRDFVTSIAWMDHARQLYARVLAYDTTVLDYWWLQQHPVAATVTRVPVWVFAVSTNKWLLSISHPLGPMTCPTLHRGPPVAALNHDLSPEALAMQNLGRNF